MPENTTSIESIQLRVEETTRPAPNFQSATSFKATGVKCSSDITLLDQYHPHQERDQLGKTDKAYLGGGQPQKGAAFS